MTLVQQYRNTLRHARRAFIDIKWPIYNNTHTARRAFLTGSIDNQYDLVVKAVWAWKRDSEKVDPLLEKAAKSFIYAAGMYMAEKRLGHGQGLIWRLSND